MIASSELEATLVGRTGVLIEITLDLIRECRRLTERINALEGQLRRVVRQLAPALLAVPGCGVPGAAAILGETAGAARFKSKDDQQRAPHDRCHAGARRRRCF